MTLCPAQPDTPTGAVRMTALQARQQHSALWLRLGPLPARLPVLVTL